MKTLLLAPMLVAVAAANPIAVYPTIKIAENCVVTVGEKEAWVVCEVTYRQGNAGGGIDPGQMVIQVPVFVPEGTDKAALPGMIKARLETKADGVLEPQSYGEPLDAIELWRVETKDVDQKHIDKARLRPSEDPFAPNAGLEYRPPVLPMSLLKAFGGTRLVDAGFSIPPSPDREFTIKVTYTQPLHEGRFVYLPQFEDGARQRDEAKFKIIIAPEGETEVKPSGVGAEGKVKNDGKIVYMPEHGVPIAVDVVGKGDSRP
ncbi:hypothetical protein Hhel01_01948 [Haloferula helveola]